MVILLFLPVKCIISYDKKASVTVRVLGIKVYPVSRKKPEKTKKEPAVKTEEKTEEQAEKQENKTESKLKELKETLRLIFDILDIFKKYAHKNLVIEKLFFSYKFGLGDAALTGVFSGGVYALVHSTAAYIYNKYKVKKQKIDILPDFDNIKNELIIYLNIKVRVINLLKLGSIFIIKSMKDKEV